LGGASSSHNDDSDHLGQESHDDHEQEHATGPAPEASGPAWPDRRAEARDALRRKREYYAYYTSEPVRHESQPPAPEASGPAPQSSVLQPSSTTTMHERLPQQQRRAQHPASVIVVDDSESSSDDESTSVSTSVGDNF